MANFFSNTTGLHSVLDALQTKAAPTVHTSVCNAFPVATSHTLTPPEGYYYSQVNVAGDSNLTANNIRKGVTVFGVEGAFDSGTDFETIPNFTYSVNPINNAQFGFVLGNDGFYESQNKGVDNSYAICRVNFEVVNDCSIIFEVINYAETNFDYVIFGKLDSSLSLSYSVDSSYHRNFYGVSSTNVRQVIYEHVPAGQHYVDVKFRKYNSQSTNNDSVKFRILESFSLNQQTLTNLVQIDSDLKPENIRRGANILGIEGTCGPSISNIGEIFYKTISGPYEDLNLTAIPSAAFFGCSKLTYLSFPFVSNIGSSAFAYCSSITQGYFPQCSVIGSSAFYNCYNLSYFSFGRCSSVGQYAFGYTNLSYLNCNIRYIGFGGFYSNSKMSYVRLYNLSSMANYAFAQCSNLRSVSLNTCKSIGNYAFSGCYNLSQLYLLSTSICSLNGSSAFTSTPFTGYSASFSGTPVIYVPSSLLASYKTASNWSYFSKYFASYVSQ